MSGGTISMKIIGRSREKTAKVHMSLENRFVVPYNLRSHSFNYFARNKRETITYLFVRRAVPYFTRFFSALRRFTAKYLEGNAM